MSSRRNTTLRQVAAEAGVSIAAASKVLHGRGRTVRVSSAKAEVIQEAASRLGYVPNFLARSMRLGATRNIGLVFERFGRISAGPLFYVEMFDGVAGRLFPRGYRLTILPEVDSLAPLSGMADGSMDGVVWCKMPEDPALLDEVARSPLPVVALNSRPPASRHPITCIACDNQGGSRLVVEHLAGLGHRRIGFVMETGEEDTPDALSRLEGLRVAMQAAGLRFDPASDLLVWDRDAGQAADWIRRGPEQTALYCWNEALGGAALGALRDLEVDVPGRVSVVGFDSTQYCDTLQPSLTAVKQPIRQMADLAAELLIRQVEEGGTAEDVVFDCTLDVRASTGPAS